MKYLYLHNLLWMLFVIISTLFEALIIYFGWLIYFLWCFKSIKNIWEKTHTENEISNHWGGYAYSDKNIIETIIRRYKFTFK
mgnify:CR=1 FL=1